MPEMSVSNQQRLAALYEQARNDEPDLTFDQFVTRVLDLYVNTCMEL